MESIKGIEIFKTGVHNGDEYTEHDLDQMVDAYGKLDFRPALKVGHSKDSPGAPAYGWITNLKRIGQKLYADFESMHDSVVQAIRDRRYDRVSAEVFFNLKRGGKVFPRALKAVALLGSEVPGVANLTPLHKMEFEAAGTFDRVSMASEQPLDAESISMTVHNRTLHHMRTSGEKSYSKALFAVLSGDAELHRTYVSAPGLESAALRITLEQPDPALAASPGWRIATLMAREMEAHPAWSQMACLKSVLEKHHDLAEDYRRAPTLASFDAVMGSGGPGK